MLKLVVNADDLGLSPAINEGILEAHLRGIVTSASLMANGEAFEHAVDLSRKTPSLDVGIHLTLVGERPLSDPSKVPSLVQVDGRLWPHVKTLAVRYWQGRIDLDDYRREIVAQFEAIVAAGIRPSHVDSHQHVHALPRLLAVTEAVAKEFGVSHVRRPVEAFQNYMLGRVTWPRLAELAGMHVATGRPAFSTDRFVGFCFGGRLNRKNLTELIKHLPASGSCELMCHPGRQDDTGRYGAWRYDWTGELEALTDPAIRAVLAEQGVELVPFPAV